MIENPFLLVKKNGVDTLLELIEATRLCFDLVRLSKRDPVYIAPLAATLRTLLTDKAKRNTPLLLRAVPLLRDAPTVFCIDNGPKLKGLKSRVSSATMAALDPSISCRRDDDRQIEISISKLHNIPVIWTEPKTYTISDVINWKANNFGGAHYAEQVNRIDAALKLNAGPMIDALILQIGYAFCSVLRVVISSVVSFDCGCIVALKREHQELGPITLTAIGTQKGEGYFSLGISSGSQPFVRIKGLDGVTTRKQAKEKVEIGDPVFLRGRHHLTENGRSEISIFLNNNLILNSISRRIPGMIFMNDLHAWNGFDPDTGAGAARSFLFGGHYWCHEALDQQKGADWFLAGDPFGHRDKHPFAVFEVGSFLHKPPDSSQHKPHGTILAERYVEQSKRV